MPRYRMYPKPEQEVGLSEYCAHARFVWNLGLEQRLMYRPGRGPTPRFVEQSRQLTEARKAEPWLAAGSAVVQQQALRDLDQAYEYFFRGDHRLPKWRKAGQREGFRIVGTFKVKRINSKWASIFIAKIGWVKFRLSRLGWETAKSYRVVHDSSGNWYVAFAVKPKTIVVPETGNVVGVDRGIAVAAALSTGEMTSPDGLRVKENERKLRLQRRLARSQHGSNRRVKIKNKISRVNTREVNRRKDWVEKTSTDLARRFDIIYIEDLRISKMMKSAKGNRNNRQKAGLNKGIISNGWGALVSRLEQKAPDRVVKVNPAYTSQTCYACKYVAKESRKSQARFHCIACGYQDNADINAAKNIVHKGTAAGHVVAARGDMELLILSVKRELKRILDMSL